VVDSCWENITTCAVGKLVDLTTNITTWGRSCGEPEFNLDGVNCDFYTDINQDSHIISGTLCTCNETRCNSPDGGVTFTQEAETAAAVVETGVSCHVCAGEEGECTSADDGGSSVDCGAGIYTCLIARTSEASGISPQAFYRGCGEPGVPAGQGLTCTVETLFDGCTCDGSLCNNPQNTSYIFSHATTTTTTTTTTSTTTTPLIPTTTKESFGTVDVTNLVNFVNTSLTKAAEDASGAGNSSAAEPVDLPALLVAELGLLPGQNLTDRCLSLDSSSQETFPITVEGVNEVGSRAANMSTGATVNLVKCFVESSAVRARVYFGVPALLLGLLANSKPSLLFGSPTSF